MAKCPKCNGLMVVDQHYTDEKCWFWHCLVCGEVIFDLNHLRTKVRIRTQAILKSARAAYEKHMREEQERHIEEMFQQSSDVDVESVDSESDAFNEIAVGSDQITVGESDAPGDLEPVLLQDKVVK